MALYYTKYCPKLDILGQPVLSELQLHHTPLLDHIVGVDSHTWDYDSLDKYSKWLVYTFSSSTEDAKDAARHLVDRQINRIFNTKIGKLLEIQKSENNN